VNHDQRVRAEQAWLDQAINWVRAHPAPSAGQVVAAVPNPHGLIVRPLAGAAIAAVAREREQQPQAPSAHPDMPPELAERRQRYESAGVRFWQDAGGWHARWPVRGGGHTGISHPADLGSLLDRLDALTELGKQMARHDVPGERAGEAAR
jgi:hypothetical protein